MKKSRVLLALSLAILSLNAYPSFAVREQIRANPSLDAPPPLPAEIIKEQTRLETNFYKPEYCDFYAQFPSEPEKSVRCEEEAPDRCYDLVSYTKVFEMASTVKAEIVCNPLPPEAFDQYTPEMMKKTVESLAMGEVMSGIEPQVKEEPNFKQAGMIGRGRAGVGDTIYVAQLWVGRRSVMAVQAEIMGEPSEEAEAHFAEILGSIGYEETEEEKAARLAKEEAEKKAAKEQPAEKSEGSKPELKPEEKKPE